MQCRLSIENHKVTVLQAAFHYHTGVDLLSDLFFSVRIIEVQSLEPFLPGLWVRGGSDDELDLVVSGKLDDFVDVVLGHFLWDG
jgi:hypothetical protein